MLFVLCVTRASNSCRMSHDRLLMYRYAHTSHMRAHTHTRSYTRHTLHTCAHTRTHTRMHTHITCTYFPAARTHSYMQYAHTHMHTHGGKEIFFPSMSSTAPFLALTPSLPVGSSINRSLGDGSTIEQVLEDAIFKVGWMLSMELIFV